MPSNSSQLRVDLVPGNIKQFRRSIESSLKDVKLSLSRSSITSLKKQIEQNVQPKIKATVNANMLKRDINTALKQRFELNLKLNRTRLATVKRQIQKNIGSFDINFKNQAFKKFEREIISFNKKLGRLEFTNRVGSEYKRKAEAYFRANPVRIQAVFSHPSRSGASGMRGGGGGGGPVVTAAPGGGGGGKRSSINTINSSAPVAIEQVNKQLRTHNTLTKEASKQQFEFGERLGFTSARLLAYLVPASAFFQIARAATFARDAIVDINRDINRLTQIFNGNASRAKSVSNDILEIARQYGQSGRELLNVSVLLAQSGEKFRDNNAIVEVVRGLAQTQLAATFGDINNVLEGTIATLNQFSLAGVDAIRVLDSANTLSKNFAFEAENLFTAVKSGGAAFSVAGGGFEEFAATVAAIRDITRLSAATVGTSLNTISLRLIRPDVVDFLETFQGGFDVRDDKGQLKSVTEILKVVGSRFSEFNQDEIGEIVQNLSGVRQGKALIPLLEDISKGEDSSRFLRALQLQETAPGSLARDAFIGQERIDIQLGKIGARFEEVFGKLADDKNIQQLTKDIVGIADALGDVLEVSAPLLPLLLKLGTIKLGIGVVRGLPGFIRQTRNNNPGPFDPGGADGIPIVGDPVGRGTGGRRSRVRLLQALRNRNADLINQQTQARLTRGRLLDRRGGILSERQAFSAQVASIRDDRRRVNNIIRGAQTNIAFASGRGNMAAADRPEFIARQQSIMRSAQTRLQELTEKRRQLSQVASANIRAGRSRAMVDKELAVIDKQLAQARKQELAASRGLGLRGLAGSAFGRISGGLGTAGRIAGTFGTPLLASAILSSIASRQITANLIDPETGQPLQNAGQISRSNAIARRNQTILSSASTGALLGGSIGIAGGLPGVALGTIIGGVGGALVGASQARSLVSKSRLEDALILASFQQTNAGIGSSLAGNIDSELLRRRSSFSATSSVGNLFGAMAADSNTLQGQKRLGAGLFTLGGSEILRLFAQDEGQEARQLRLREARARELLESPAGQAINHRLLANIRTSIGNDPNTSIDSIIRQARSDIDSELGFETSGQLNTELKLLIKNIENNSEALKQMAANTLEVVSAFETTISSLSSLVQGITEQTTLTSARGQRLELTNSIISAQLGSGIFNPFTEQAASNRSSTLLRRSRRAVRFGLDPTDVLSSSGLSTGDINTISDLAQLQFGLEQAGDIANTVFSTVPRETVQGGEKDRIRSEMIRLVSANLSNQLHTPEARAERDRVLDELSSIDPVNFVGGNAQTALQGLLRVDDIRSVLPAAIDSRNTLNSELFKNSILQQQRRTTFNTNALNASIAASGIQSRLTSFRLGAGLIGQRGAANDFRNQAGQFGAGNLVELAQTLNTRRLSAQAAQMALESAEDIDKANILVAVSQEDQQMALDALNIALSQSSTQLNLVTQEYQLLQQKVNGIISSLDAQSRLGLGARLRNNLSLQQGDQVFGGVISLLAQNNISTPQSLANAIGQNPELLGRLLGQLPSNLPQEILNPLLSARESRGNLPSDISGLTSGQEAANLRTLLGLQREVSRGTDIHRLISVFSDSANAQQSVDRILSQQLDAQKTIVETLNAMARQLDVEVPNNVQRRPNNVDNNIDNNNNIREDTSSFFDALRSFRDVMESIVENNNQAPAEQNINVDGDTRIEISGFDNVGRAVASGLVIVKILESFRDKLNLASPIESRVRDSIDGAIREFKNAQDFNFNEI